MVSGNSKGAEQPAPRRLVLDETAWLRIRRACVVAAPREACGVCLGLAHGDELVIHELHELRNLALEHGAYRLDPGGLRAAHDAAEAAGLELLGYWHSHPLGDPRPSGRDLAGTPVGACQVIVAGAEAREVAAWWRAKEGFRRLGLSERALQGSSEARSTLPGSRPPTQLADEPSLQVRPAS